MREISRFLTFFMLFLTVILGVGAVLTLYWTLMDTSSPLGEPINTLWIGGCLLVLMGCVLFGLRLIQKLRATGRRT